MVDLFSNRHLDSTVSYSNTLQMHTLVVRGTNNACGYWKQQLDTQVFCEVKKVSDKLFKLYLIVIPLDSDVQDTTVICIWNVSQSVINSSFVMPLPLG